MKVVKNQMLMASAGSGKTYQLTNRYIALLAHSEEVAPERIVALTFTRKAAGEFLDSILQKLAEASEDEVVAQRLSSEINWDGGSAEYRELLLTVVARIHRLGLGTLDSFFSRIVGAFPLELGLSGGFSILDEYGSEIEKARTLGSLFEDQGDGKGLSGGAMADFLAAFQRATFGEEEARLVEPLSDFLKGFHELYLAIPNAELWGSPRQIWESELPFDLIDDAEFMQRVSQVRKRVEADGELTDGQRQKWMETMDGLEIYVPGGAMEGTLGTFLAKPLSQMDELARGRGEIMVARKKQALSEGMALELSALMRGYLGREMAVWLQRTVGIHSVLERYEGIYGALVRGRGKLTFGDLTRVLLGADGGVLKGGSDAKLQLDYRLDARIDHWLLDEFQDTSRDQWRAVENLIDEAVQDADERGRSVFVVGDVKQSIYRFRGGEPKLASELVGRYGDQIEVGTMPESRRSRPAVIAAVNRVFGDRAALGDVVPEGALARWQWEDHLAHHQEMEGFACLINPGGKEKEDRFAVVLGILEEVKPVERGLSCCVLVQDNKTAGLLLAYLRENGCSSPSTSESDQVLISESAVCAALFSLLRVSVHPGDELGWGHLRVTPLWDLIQKAGGRDAVVRAIQQESSVTGYAGVIAEWRKLLEEADVLDAFARERAAQFEVAARAFDQSGAQDGVLMIQFLRGYKIRDLGAASAVQIMTVHKAKGLTYDMAILADVEGNKLTSKRVSKNPVMVHRDDTGAAEWVLRQPRTEIVEAIPELAAANALVGEENAYEALCKLYVAMTRPKFALYMVAEPPSKTALNYRKLLGDTLGESSCGDISLDDGSYSLSYREGENEWWSKVGLEAEAPLKEAKISFFQGNGRQGEKLVPEPMIASGESEGVEASDLMRTLNGYGAAAAEFGTLVHALFEQVEWLDSNSDLDSQLEVMWKGVQDKDGKGMEVVKECLGVSEIRNYFQGDRAAVEVWRERSFDVLVSESKRVVGVFDRVIVGTDFAVVLDFKTDRCSEGGAKEVALRHADQLQLYRSAVSVLTGLPEETIMAGVVVCMAGVLEWVD